VCVCVCVIIVSSWFWTRNRIPYIIKAMSSKSYKTASHDSWGMFWQPKWSIQGDKKRPFWLTGLIGYRGGRIEALFYFACGWSKILGEMKFPKYLYNSSKERKFWFLTTHKKTHTQQHTITVTLAISLFVFVVVCFGNCQTKRVPQCVQEPSRMPHNSLPTQQNIYFSCLSSPHSPLSLVT